MAKWLFNAAFLLLVWGVLAEPALDAPRRVLTLRHTSEFKRLSEGDVEPLRDGSLLFVYTRFTAGQGDHDHADLVARRSPDGGLTWTTEDELVVRNHAALNVMSVSLLRLGNGNLALFYLSKDAIANTRPVMRVSSDEGRTWSDYKYCVGDDAPGYYVMNNDRAVRLTTGRIILPLAKHPVSNGTNIGMNSVPVSVYSDDDGATWRFGAPSPRAVDADGRIVTLQEPGVVEKKCGGLLLWARTDHGEQWQTHSSDLGFTWRRYTASPLVSPCSPAQIVRLANGDLVAIWNDHASHPELKASGRRTPLALGLSRDGGKTWPVVKTLEGNLSGYFAYPSLREVGSNLVLSYCCADGLVDIRVTLVPTAWLYSLVSSADRTGFFVD